MQSLQVCGAARNIKTRQNLSKLTYYITLNMFFMCFYCL
jgi:hypothetical protein